MDQCSQCGAELGIGRFCTNCGHPVAEAVASQSWPTDTAERPRVTVPPPATPGPAHFPFYADDPQARADEQPSATSPYAAPPRHRDEEPRRRSGAGWVPWAIGFLLMALIAVAGSWLLFSGEDRPSVLARETPSAAEGSPGRDRTPEPEPSTEAPPSDPVEATELAPSARIVAPRPAPPSQDSSGNTVDYAATNMTDDLEETAWRMPGDGSGETITFRLDSPAVLTSVGLLNGYAKVGQDSAGLLDWYAGNRRLVEVEWSFDDGTTVTQSLTETAQLQTMEIDSVETRSVTLRLLEVTAPGTGRASRDYTAISEVSLLGTR